MRAHTRFESRSPDSSLPRWVTNHLAMILVGIFWFGCAEPKLEEYGTVAPFTLVKHTGETFDSAEMKGDVWVVSFFFTRCRNHLPTAIEPFVHGTRLCKGQRDLAPSRLHFSRPGIRHARASHCET